MAQNDAAAPLAEVLQAKNDALRSGMDEGTLEVIDAGVQHLIDTDAGKDVIQVGSEVPDFTLTSDKGAEVSLSSLLEGGKPAVVSFFRGSWCPYCNVEAAYHNKHLAPVLSELGVSLVAISPMLESKTGEMVGANDADGNPFSFDFLSDTNNKVAKSLGLVFELDANTASLYDNFFNHAEVYGEDTPRELPIPATLVIGADRTVKFIHADLRYNTRANVSEVISAVRSHL